MVNNLITYAWINVTRRLKITAFLFLCVAVSVFSVVLAWTSYDTMEHGIELSKERLSADVVALPYETELSDVAMLYSGVAQSVYMDESVIGQLTNEYVDQISAQYYLQTIPTTGCCTVTGELRIVGVDWKNDFTVKSYLQGKQIEDLDLKDIVVGSNVILEGEKTLILNLPVNVVGRLEQTGTYLDDSLIVNMEQLKSLARINFPPSFFGNREPDKLVTCALIRLKPGVDKEEYLLSVEEVEAKKVLVSSVTESIQQEIDVLFRLLAGASVMILILGMIAIFSQINTLVNSQHQEIGYLRAIGAPKGHIYRIFLYQVGIVVASAGVLSSALGVFAAQYVVNWVHNNMTIPMLAWSNSYIAVHVTGGIVLAIMIGVISAIVPLCRAANVSPQDLMARGDV